MRSNKSNASKQSLIKKIKPIFLHGSIAVISRITDKIMDGVNCEVERIEKIRSEQKKLIQFAKIKQKNYFYGYLNQMLADEPSKTHFKHDEQPTGISMDTLAIACLQKTRSKSIKSALNESTSLAQSFISEIKTQKSKMSKQPSIKLPLETIEQVKYITQMRQKKISDEQNLKKQGELAEQEKAKSLKKQTQSKISVNFDYNGKILYRRNIEHGNLILKNIEQKLKKQKIVKRVSQPPEPQQVLPIQKQKYMKKNRTKIIEDEFTEFLDSQSLTDSIEINRGIRYSHNALVFQEKKHTLSSRQLKNQLGNRKFSKQDLSRVKQLEKVTSNKLRKLKTEQFKGSSFSHKRSLSEANFASSRLRQREVINVMNPELRSSMLIRLSQYEPYLVIQKQFPEDPNLFYEPKQADSITNLSEVQRNELDSRSYLTDRTRMTPKLPPIHRKQPISKAIDDELIISKLQQELQSKLRI